ncbi:hypothetical protein KKF82_08755 [Patescibacteria group bacterium]|nr:hypothetical protein [Patescibacteria group bacterium]
MSYRRPIRDGLRPSIDGFILLRCTLPQYQTDLGLSSDELNLIITAMTFIKEETLAPDINTLACCMGRSDRYVTMLIGSLQSKGLLYLTERSHGQSDLWDFRPLYRQATIIEEFKRGHDVSH